MTISPIEQTQIRPHWYDSDEENVGSEYDTDSEEEDPTSVTWTHDEAVKEIQDYLEDKMIDCIEIEEDETMVLGTCLLLDNKNYMSIKLDISAYLKYGALHTKYFGYLHETWVEEKPYEIMKVSRVLEDGFVEYRAIIKTFWLRLIQRHWKNRKPNQKLCGLLRRYNTKYNGF